MGEQAVRDGTVYGTTYRNNILPYVVVLSTESLPTNSPTTATNSPASINSPIPTTNIPTTGTWTPTVVPTTTKSLLRESPMIASQQSIALPTDRPSTQPSSNLPTSGSSKQKSSSKSKTKSKSKSGSKIGSWEKKSKRK